MAQFYARIKGQRGEATRLGNKVTGMTATVNGWNAGVRVEARHENGQDVFVVYRTAGSNSRSSDTHLATIVEGED